MDLTELLAVATPLLTAISALAGILWRREVQRGDRLQEDLEVAESAINRLVAAIAVGATTEDMREELASYLRGDSNWQAPRQAQKGRRR